ncbi:MAG TPA: hypothetical protein VL240_00305 [Candidatus Binatia bacterium]|nr:hypothetical protein [Candidatus Binatia bacterium]
MTAPSTIALFTVNAAAAGQDPPMPHWPWWLRVIAVIAVLFFVRLVVQGVRRAGSGR